MEQNKIKQVFVLNPKRQEKTSLLKAEINDEVLMCKTTSCKGMPLISDESIGEIICGCCGSIVVEKSVDIRPEKTGEFGEFSSKMQNGPEQSFSGYDMGMTIISDRDAFGKPLSGTTRSVFNRLKRLDSRSKTRSSNRTLKFTLLFLDSLKANLGIPDSVAENATYIYRKSMQKKITVGRSAKSLMCASVYAACRQDGIPRSITDISRKTGISKKEICRAYRTLLEGLDMTLGYCSASEFVPKIANDARISRKSSRDSLEYLQLLTKKRLSEGKSPLVLAAAALYLACVLNGEPITQDEIAKASGTTATALRTRYSVLKKEMDC